MVEQDDTGMDLAAALDRLYGGSPAAFVQERNELAKALRRSGDKEAAERVARLARPSPVAFSVNRLHFDAPELLVALRETGSALRAAQESAVDVDEFNDRKRAHERSLRAAVDRALALAESAGAGSGASFRRRLEMTLNLLGTAPGEAGEAGEATGDASTRPGRMSAELSPAGFDAFGGVEIAARPPSARAAKTSRAPANAARLEQVASVKAALDAADKELRRLEREAELADETERRAARDAEEAAQRAEAARERHADTVARARTARSSADEARRQVDEARRALAELEG